MFPEFFHILMTLFGLGDRAHYECDYNKLELCNFLWHMLIDSPRNVDMLANATKANQLREFI